MKILLIEDNDVDARACKRMLAEHREEEFSVSRARTMSEGLNLINDVCPAVILADLGLPDSRGSESVDRLVKSQFFGPIIVLTGQVSEEHALEALASGVADYLVKDQITADSVRRSIRYCLERWSSANQIRLQAELLNRTNEAVVVAKPDGSITYRNKGANNLLAKIADHSPQGNLFKLLGYSESRIQELLESITERDTVEFEDSILGNENSTLNIKSRWNLSQSPEPHNALELIIVLSDITRQREISRRVQEKQKLECLGVLAGGIAHDFNNILAAMMLSVEDILLGGQLSASMEADLKVIKSSIERAASLCSQLLAYAGQHGGQVQKIQINDQIHEVYRILQTSLGTSIKFETTLDPDLPPIAANAGQINQIIMNLLLNAAEALEGKSGTISVTTGRKICQTNESDGFILNASTGHSDFIFLQIQDAGKGMDTETLERVFDPFYSTKATGRGLGLAAVHGIVRSQKGMIQVKSNPDAGTCFRIYLPITEALPKNGDTHSHRLNSTSPKAPGRVLLVDDEEIVRTGTRMLLERLGYLVTCAGDGFEAIARFEQQARDTQAVLLDITMPGRDGFQVFKEIRNIDPTVPIILMSGYAEESATNELLEIGNPKFLEKPFTADELRQTIEAAIR